MSRWFDDWPDLSIIVPVGADPDGLVWTLDSLLESRYPTHAYEIRVICDSEATTSMELLDAYAGNFDRVKPHVEATYHTPGAARNIGIRNATGEVLFFIDANMTIREGSLADLVTTFQQTPAPYMGCGIEIDSDEDRRTLLAEYDRLSFLQVRRWIRDKSFCPTSALVTTRDLFEDVGYFDPELVSHEDFLFGRQVAEAGYALAFDADVARKVPECRPVTLCHPARETVAEQFRRAFKMGRGKCQLACKHGRPADPLEILHRRMTYAFQARTRFHERFEGWESLSPGQQLWMILFQRAHRLAWLCGAVSQYSVETDGNGTDWTRHWEISSPCP